jgi:hypothetical protein
MRHEDILYTNVETDFDLDGYFESEDCEKVYIPHQFLIRAVHKGVVSSLLHSQTLWEDEVIEYEDDEDSADEGYVRDYMRVQLGLSFLTIDSEYILEDKTLILLKEKFSFVPEAYNRYMDDMFFRCNSSKFGSVHKDDVEWNEGFDVEKEKNKPFLMYHDWLNEKDNDGVSNYDKYVKDKKYETDKA